MDTPGYDPVSATGQVAGGANMICFTTGRGSVFGCRPVAEPEARHATREMYRAMAEDMDVNCGAIADGRDLGASELGERIFELILEVASGPQDGERGARASAKRSSRPGSSAR